MSGTPFPVPRSLFPPALMLALGLASVAAGQEAIVSPGERIRVKHACEGEAKPAPCQPAVGKVRAVVGDTILLDDGGNGERRLVLGPASQIELSSGRHGHALLGFGLGILAGAAVGALSVRDCQNSHTGSDMGGLCVLQYFVTVPAGALTGIIVGAVLKKEKWHTLERRAARLEVLPAVSPNGLAVAGTLWY